MVTRILIIVLATLIAVSSSSISYAQGLPTCNPGTGQWVLSTGTVQCRKCPKPEDFYPGKAFKLPLGCMAPLAGALLDIEDYLDLKSAKEYAVELENWRINLGPTLDNLHMSVTEARANLAASLKEKDTVVTMLAKIKLQNEALKTQIRTVIITSSIAATLLAVPLVILVSN